MSKFTSFKNCYSKLLYLLLVLVFSSTVLEAQVTIQVTVNDGFVTTTCTDVLSAPDPLFSVNVQNAGWVSYPSNGNCFNDFPNLQYNEVFQCVTDIPPTLQICLRAFENDPNPFINCDVNEDCLVELCGDFPLPPTGSGTFLLELPDGMASDGEINFTIDLSGFPAGINDLPCDAIDLGVLPESSTIGDGSQSLFSNYCGTPNNEPNPTNSGTFWNNDVGTWFQFTTGPNPGSTIQVFANSDPSGIGDLIKLQLAVYETDDNSCTGNYNLISAFHDPTDDDELVLAPCLEPNTNYWILVDGSSDSADELNGWFGIEVTDYGTTEAGDLICDALEMGIVPDGSFVEATLQTNFCAGSIDDPPVNGFGTQTSVWFAFTPPTSGHVNVQAFGNLSANLPLDIQMAVFEGPGGCLGGLTQVSAGVDPPGLDATIELSCLDPNSRYYVVIDGAANQNNVGVFDFRVTDLGDDTPVTDQMVVRCDGESLIVGSSIYTQTGMYSDTIILPNGCDSIVNTDLQVLDEIMVDVSIEQLATGQGNADGIVTATGTGGTGIYSFIWSDGHIGATNTNLVGGDNYCVTIVDTNGCEDDTCFVMPFIEDFIPIVTGDTLDCFGDNDGMVTLTAFSGEPPYTFAWEKSDMSISGAGSIPADNVDVTFDNLTAGTYFISIMDNHFDTIVSIDVLEPAALDIAIGNIQNASCFGLCDGFLALVPSGGTAPYQLSWSSGGSGNTQNGLCAGFYDIVIEDANQCQDVFTFEITEPAEFIVQAMELQSVSCIGGNDGQATVTTNGNPIDFDWDNGGTGQTISGLTQGTYMVTVQNDDGCTGTSSVTITEPSEPVSVQIIESQAITCHGNADAILEAQIAGPGNSFTYLWSNGEFGQSIDNIGVGVYTVTVTNELGCSAVNSITVSEPLEMDLTYFTSRETCEDGGVNGTIGIENVSGGVSPFVYSLHGDIYSPDPLFDGLSGGSYTLYVQDAGGCIKTFDIFVEGTPNLTIDLGPDIEVLLGDSIVLDGSAATDIPNLIYSWEPANFFSCPDCPVQSFYPPNSMTVEITVLDELTACTETDIINIDVNKIRRVYIPNAFSPNDDGLNDIFTIYGGSDVVEVKMLRIFDRNGALVFEAENFQPEDLNNGWDGRFLNEKVNSGVYVYFAEILFRDNETELFRGDLSVVR